MEEVHAGPVKQGRASRLGRCIMMGHLIVMYSEWGRRQGAVAIHPVLAPLYKGAVRDGLAFT